MQTVVFIDAHSPYAEPTEPDSLARGGVGGSEATLVRVAEALGKKHRVFVAQHQRRSGQVTQGAATYIPLQDLPSSNDVDAVVVLRNVLQTRLGRKRYPKQPLFLWATDFLDSRPGHLWRVCFRAAVHHNRATVVPVSKAHAANLQHQVRPGFWDAWLRPKTIPFEVVYNPVEDHILPDDTPVDVNKLLFFSRPDIRLGEVLRAFEHVRRHMPELTLYVANPGYMPLNLQSGVRLIVLGCLPHHEILKHVRSALCTFYPQTSMEEAFGLVYAESNAVGTPVLAHRMGAAPEILSDEQFVDARDLDAVVATLKKWRLGGRPKVELQPQFRLARVVERWEEVLHLR